MFRRIAEEVAQADADVAVVGPEAVRWLKEQALGTRRRRMRLCAHPGPDDLLHEMLIVHPRAAYVPPHKHPGKSESFHVVDGRLTVFLFDESGAIVRTIPMGAGDPDRAFYYRLSEPLYHTVVPESDLVVFHEVTNGPFRREDTVFAPWAPADSPAGVDAETAALQAAFVETLMPGILGVPE